MANNGFANNGATLNQKPVDINKAFASGGLTTSYTPPQTGLIQNNANSNTHTVTTNNSGGTVTKPTPNKSVLAQQQALNKLGAGLVEDGIAGPKTAAAIAKYGTGSSGTNAGMIKEADDPSNKYNTTTGQLNTKYSGYINSSAPTNTPNPSPQVSTDPLQNAQNVSNAGGQSQNEYDTQKRLIELGKQASPEYQAAQEEAKRVSEQAVDYAKDYSQKTNNIAGTAGFLTQQTGLQGQLNQQYNTVQDALAQQYAGATNRLGAANTQQGLLNQAAGAAYTGSQTQAGRGLSAAGTVLDASLPGQQGTSSQLYNPLQGAQGGNSVVSGANRQSAYDLTQQKNEIQSVFNGAEANFKLLVDTARQGGVNDTNIPAINAIQQSVQKGLTSSSAVINFQNTLATVRSQYAQILGGGTATVDSQHRAEEAIPNNISLGALMSLEQQLKSEATNRIAGIDNQVKSLTSGSSTNSSGGSGGNMFGSFFGQ